jgi:putative SOS response-associated peptidase YedK
LRGPDAQVIESCSIITGPPNELVASIHDRQPIILADTSFDVWLNPEPLDAAAAMTVLVPYAAADMECWEVSPAVNSACYTGADATARIA